MLILYSKPGIFGKSLSVLTKFVLRVLLAKACLCLQNLFYEFYLQKPVCVYKTCFTSFTCKSLSVFTKFVLRVLLAKVCLRLQNLFYEF